MGNKAREKQYSVGMGKILGLKGNIGEIVARVVQRHDDHN
jgi:hypothetical protein